MSRAAAERAFAECIPLWRTTFSGDLTYLVTPGLDYVGALELTPLDARFAGAGAIADCGEALRSFIGSVDEHCTLQFIYRVTNDVDGEIAAHEDVHRSAAGEAIPALWEFTKSRVRWLKEQKLRQTRVYLFFSGPSPTAALARGQLGMRMFFASLEKYSAAQHDERLKSLTTLRNSLVARLSQARIHARQLHPDEVRQLYFEVLNPNHTGALKHAPRISVRDDLWSDKTIAEEGLELREYTEAEQLTFEEVEEHRGYLQQQTVFRRAHTLKVLPESGTQYLQAESLLGLSTRTAEGAVPFPYWLTVTISVQPQGKARWLLSTQHGLVDALRNAVPFLANKSVAAQTADAAKQRGIAALFEELTSTSSRLVRLSVSLLLDASSLMELNERTEAARAAFSHAGNSELLMEEVTQLPAFLSMLPGSGCYQLRSKQCTSRNAADFLPVWAPWRGTSRAVSLYTTPTWDTFRLDLFDNMVPAHHGLVVADTGSGKSVSLGAMTLDAVASGVDAILVDNGGSWAPLTQLLGGVHVPVDLRTSIAPFRPYAEMLTEAGELDSEAVQDVVTYLELCTREEDESGFDKLTLQLVARAVQQVYARLRQAPAERPLMSSFRDSIQQLSKTCAHADDRRICEQVSRRLGLFCGDELYGSFLDRPSTLRFDARVLTFDMAGVSKSPVTRSIAMATLMQAITARAARRSGRRTLVEVDEGHVYLGQDPTAERFLERCYRVMRKFGVAMWMISQQFGDFAKAKSGEAIIGNSPIKIFLRHASGHRVIGDYFKLSDRALSAFQRLEMSKGRYSDFFLMYGERMATVRLALHPLAYWILTTDVADKALIERAVEKNPNLSRIDVLKELSRRYPRGASGPVLKVA